jgi:Flp pilus assembly protein TadB
VWRFSFSVRFSPSFSLSPSLSLFSLSLLASLDLFHLIGLVLCQVTRKERKKKRKKKINNSPKSTFFFLSTIWWTQVIRKTEKEKDWNLFTIMPVYRTTKANHWKRTHIHSYTTRMIMLMMMIQFYIFNIDIWSLSFLLASLFLFWLLFLDVLSHVYNHVKLFCTHILIYIYISSFYYVSCLHLLILA